MILLMGLILRCVAVSSKYASFSNNEWKKYNTEVIAEKDFQRDLYLMTWKQ